MRIRFLVGVLLACLVAPSAQAYVMTAEFLVRLLAEARRDLGARDFSLTLTADLAKNDHQIDERLYLKRPERSRLVLQDDNVTVQVDKEGQTGAGDEHVVKGTGSSNNLVPILLMPKGKDLDEMQARLLHVVQGLGIDTKVVSLGRLNDAVAYIIGAHTWEADKPQVWLDKTTFFPVRIIVPVQHEGKTVLQETRLLEYGAGPGGNGLPRIIEEYADGQLVSHAEVTAVQFNQDLPETMFDLSGRRH